MMRTALLFIALGQMCFSFSYAQGYDPTSYDFHPDLQLRLGTGFNPSNPKSAIRNCFKVTKSRLDTSDSAIDAATQTSLAFNSYSLSAAQNVEARISARILKSSFSGSYTNSFSETINNNSIFVISHVRVIYGRNIADDVEIINPADKELAKKDPKAFLKKCGSKIVITESIGNQLNAIIELSSLDARSKQQVEAVVNGRTKLGPIKISVSAKMSSVINEANKNGNLSIYATGPDAASLTAKLLRPDIIQNDPISNIMNTLSETLSSMAKPKFDNVTGLYVGPIIKYGIGDVSSFVDLGSSVDLWTNDKEEMLNDMVSQWFLVSSDIQAIDGLISGDSPLVTALGDLKVKEYIALRPKLVDYRNRISNAHSRCTSNGSYDSGACIMPKSIILPKLLGKLSESIKILPKISIVINDKLSNKSLSNLQAMGVLSEVPNLRAELVSRRADLKLGPQSFGYLGFGYVQDPGNSITSYEFYYLDSDGKPYELMPPMNTSNRVLLFYGGMTDDQVNKHFDFKDRIGLESKFVDAYCANEKILPLILMRYRDVYGNSRDMEFSRLAKYSASPERCKDFTFKYSF